MKHSSSTLKWLLSELALAEPEQYESGSFEIVGEDEQGREGCCEVEVSDIACSAKDRIEELENSIRETIGFIESTNSIDPEVREESIRLLVDVINK